MSALRENTTTSQPQGFARWLLAAGWIGLVLCPAALLMFVALGQWRIPLDACALAALLTVLRTRVSAWLLWTAYYLVVGLFILHCFNLSLSSLSFYAEFSGSIPPPQLSLILSAVASAFVAAAGASFVPDMRSLRWRVMILTLFVTLVGVCLRAFSAAPLALRYALPVPTLTLVTSTVSDLRLRRSVATALSNPPPPPLDAAIAASPLPDQLFLFTVESWADGVEGQARLVDVARSQFGDRLIEVKTGFRPSYGATLQGELRELCGMERPIDRLSDVPFNKCLPNRLKASGYETVAGHGYQSMFYLRTALYPRLGFTQSFFLEDLERNLPTCSGPFPGLCDLALLDHLLGANSPQQKRIIYQMTLQSHEPVSSKVLAEYGIRSAETGSIAVAHAFIERAMERLAAPRGADCGALVYFVGDHPPPSLKASGEFREEVSFLLLRLAPTHRCEVQ